MSLKEFPYGLYNLIHAEIFDVICILFVSDLHNELAMLCERSVDDTGGDV
jgi:hypothetical protein